MDRMEDEVLEFNFSVFISNPSFFEKGNFSNHNGKEYEDKFTKQTAVSLSSIWVACVPISKYE